MPDEFETGLYHAEDGPAKYCVFCRDQVVSEAAEAEIVLMSDYVDTNLGENTPGRRVGLCHHHLELLTDRVPKTEDLVA